jgi:cystathionine gamma-synthase
MPDSVHAVSACLPLWDHNVRYEEGDPAVIGRLQAAYPRFCLNPFVRELCRRTFGADNLGLVFPSPAVAHRALKYTRSRGAASARLMPLEGQSACGVAIAPDEFPRLREYWQHAGEVLTSRAAELILNGFSVSTHRSTARAGVYQRIAALHGCDVAGVRLHVCGMAAISSVWRAIRRRDPDSPSVQFGFPYVDTLKIQQRFAPSRHHLFAVGDSEDLRRLESLLATQRICAVFCEVPTNPLLQTPDLIRLRELADQHDFILVVDDTLTACINQRLLPLADVIVTSLTKYFSGRGDVLAGCSVVNPASRHAEWLNAELSRDFEELLPDVDVEVLYANSHDLEARVSKINANAMELAGRLAADSRVESVFYPGLNAANVAAATGSPPLGHGGLLSIVLRDAARTTPAFFDALSVCKGPNLGTHFTLCCPYTILAHYTELDAVEACGVSRWLLRFSIGMEPVELLWSRLDSAFG